MWWLFRHFRFVFFASTMEFVTANGQCRAKVNIQGMALKRFVGQTCSGDIGNFPSMSRKVLYDQREATSIATLSTHTIPATQSGR